MNEESFRNFLKKKGKKNDVIERNIKSMQVFIKYLQSERNKELSKVNSDDIQSYVSKLEQEKKSPKGSLYVLINYLLFLENKELLKFTRILREERTKQTRKEFLIKDFIYINQEIVKKLEGIGIKNVKQMLEAGKTKVQREQLSNELKISGESILEIVKLSDITRLGYVKKKLARLYYNAGLDSPQKVAEFNPESLHEYFKKFVKESGWDGMVPNQKDLVNNINNAKKLKKLVED